MESFLQRRISPWLKKLQLSVQNYFLKVITFSFKMQFFILHFALLTVLSPFVIIENPPDQLLHIRPDRFIIENYRNDSMLPSRISRCQKKRHAR